MMKKILFACALEREMADLQRFYRENKDQLSYQCDFLKMGYGRSEVVKSLVKVLRNKKYDLLVNVGTSGFKDKDHKQQYKIGDLVEPISVYDGDFDLEDEVRLLPLRQNKIEGELPPPVLVTVSSFGRYDSHINRNYVEDMEGYEIANICSSLGQPALIMKVISNYITNDSEKDMAQFYENCEKVMVQNTKNIFHKVTQCIESRQSSRSASRLHQLAILSSLYKYWQNNKKKFRLFSQKRQSTQER